MDRRSAKKTAEDILALAAHVSRAADVRAASVVLGEPPSGSGQVYELRLIAKELRALADQLTEETTRDDAPQS